MSFWINGKSEEGVSKGWIWFPRKSKPSLKERLAILLFQCGYRHNVITVRVIFWCLLSARHFIDISNSPKPCKASIFILVLQLTKVGLTEVSDPPQAISLVTEWVSQDRPNKKLSNNHTLSHKLLSWGGRRVYFHLLRPQFHELPFSKITNREYLKSIGGYAYNKSTLTIKILMIAIIMIQIEQM